MKHNNLSGSRGYGYPNFHPKPLMTNNLQIRDLDRELQILRNKREIVQREQQMLTLEREIDRKRQYEQTNRNVSDMYGNVWQPPLSKRIRAPQQLNPWMSTTQDTLRPNMPQSVPANYIPSLLSKKIEPPVNPMMMKPIVHPILKNTVNQRLVTPVNVRKDFRFTQALRKKRKAPPNNLNSYPINERKDLVSKAMNDTDSKPPEETDILTLREDQIPNNQVTGRLELALGSIVKEIRLNNCHNEIFKSLISNPIHRRTMKQAVRERIRTVMLNKRIVSVVDIVNKYRERFPKRTDTEIVELVVNYEHPKLLTVIESESPEEFFKKNINSIIEKKIQEMSSNLRKMYTDVRRNAALAYTKAVDSNEKQSKSIEKEYVSKDETSMKVLRALTGKYVTIEERNILSKFYTELIENIMEQKLPEYLPKCTEHFLKIFDADYHFKTIKFIATKRIMDEIKTKRTKNVKKQNDTSDNRVDEVTEETNNEIGKETETETYDVEQTVIGNNDTQAKILPENIETDKDKLIENNETQNETNTENNTQQEKLIENNETKKDTNTENNTQQEKLTQNNDTQKEKVTENEDVQKEKLTQNNDTQKDKLAENNDSQDETFIKNICGKEITVETNNVKIITPVNLTPVVIAAEEASSSTKSETSISITTQESSECIKPKPTTTMAINTNPSTKPIIPVSASTSSAKEITYFAKLIGVPKLPSRAAICEFLNGYRPDAIKKHKSIKNLLVVGFVNQEAYEKILTANETVIDDITIMINSNEKVNPVKKNESIKKDIDEVLTPIKEEKDLVANDSILEGIDALHSEHVVKAENSSSNDTSEDLIGKDLDDQITNLLSTIRDSDENIKKSEVEIKNGETHGSDKADKISKAKVKESGRATPVRSSSRLGNVTPSTIRTRRASRLMQE